MDSTDTYHINVNVPTPPAAPNKLNIVTATRADGWVYNHIPRFVYYIDRYAGPCKKHIILCVPNTVLTAEAEYIHSQLERYFDVVQVLKEENHWEDDKTMYFDQLRATFLDRFGLKEALYLDPDIDILEDMSHLTYTAPAASLLWVSNTIVVKNVAEDIQGVGDTDSSLQPIEPGFMYMRKSFANEINEAIAKYPPKTLNSIPGLFYWEVIKQYEGKKAVQLPSRYNRTFWDIPGCVKHAGSVHYTGRWKNIQPYVEYVREPATDQEPYLHIHPTPIVHEGYEIKKFSDIQ